MEFKDLSKKVKKVKEAYEELSRKKKKKVWGATEYAQGLAGDTGDLIKLLVLSDTNAKDKKLHNKICHELADCLWSVIVLAQELNVDIEKELLINMEYLKQKLDESKK